MMRNKTPSSMQKTYDDCYLICSTAVYFEGQVNPDISQWTSPAHVSDWKSLSRTTKPKLYAHGVPLSIRFITTMPTEHLQTTNQNRKLRKRFKTHYVIWSCSAKSGLTCLRLCERVGRRARIADSRPTAAIHYLVDRPPLPNQSHKQTKDLRQQPLDKARYLL